jgi:hypothetical protein
LIKDLGALNYFIGIEVDTIPIGFHLMQIKYLQTILEKAQMTGATFRATLMQSGMKLSKFDGSPLPNPLLYHLVVGMLQ